MSEQVTIVIPSYKPTNELLKLLEQLTLHQNLRFLIINDGSPESDNKIFTKASEFPRTEVLTHAVNLGKGRALKTAFHHCLLHHNKSLGVVTADSDGQHRPQNIIEIAQKLIAESLKISKIELNFILLGSRQFKPNTPLRSRLGNGITQFIFQKIIGLKVSDTQTGLRAIPRNLLSYLLEIPGERYEYETNMLLECSQMNIQILESPIEAVYFNENKNSHFNPIKDSMRIYFLIFRFLSSSLSSSLLDILLFTVLYKNGFDILSSTLMARFIFSWINFYVNRKLVFKDSRKIWGTLLRYWLLVMTMGIISSFIVMGLNHFSDQVIILKFMTESTLFLASFSIQKEFIFNTHTSIIKEPKV